MMPVGAGGGGFLRGRPAKPPSSRGSLPPGPARARAGGEGSGLAGAPGPGAPGRAGGGGAGCQRGPGGPGRGPGSGVGGGGRRGRAPGGGVRAGIPGPAPPRSRRGPSCRASGCGCREGKREGKSEPVSFPSVFSGGRPGGEAGVPSGAGRRPRLAAPVTPPAVCCRGVGSRRRGHPRVAFPRWKPPLSRSLPGAGIPLLWGIHSGRGFGEPS